MFYTWERKCNVAGLRGSAPDSPPWVPDSPPWVPDSPPWVPDSPPWVLGFWAFRDSWRSNLTLVSPTQRARYLLKQERCSKHKTNIIISTALITLLLDGVMQLNTHGRSGFNSLLEIHILSISYKENKQAEIHGLRKSRNRAALHTHECHVNQVWELQPTIVCWGWNWTLIPRTEKSPTDWIFSSAFRTFWKNRTARLHMNHLEKTQQSDQRLCNQV